MFKDKKQYLFFEIYGRNEKKRPLKHFLQRSIHQTKTKIMLFSPVVKCELTGVNCFEILFFVVESNDCC